MNLPLTVKNTALPILVIPAYNPSHELPKIVRTSLDYFQKVVIVNDGSSSNYSKIFKILSEIKEVSLLEHAINLGKGAALKTAFNYVLLKHSNACGVVTMDADGQHSVGDAIRLGQYLFEDPVRIYLGSRTFTKDIPLKSFLGNIITNKVFTLLIGKALRDTQTGLRGLPLCVLPKFLHIETSGYEFELESLIQAQNISTPIKEVDISTIYTSKNETSHFNPIIDSIKIYFVFFRYFFSSFLVSVFDLFIFSICYYFFSHIFLSLLLGRISLGIINFYMVKKFVFYSNEGKKGEIIKFFSLVFASMLIIYGMMLFLIDRMAVNPYLSKILSEVTLFLLNFIIQRFFVFRI